MKSSTSTLSPSLLMDIQCKASRVGEGKESKWNVKSKGSYMLLNFTCVYTKGKRNLLWWEHIFMLFLDADLSERELVNADKCWMYEEIHCRTPHQSKRQIYSSKLLCWCCLHYVVSLERQWVSKATASVTYSIYF